MSISVLGPRDTVLAYGVEDVPAKTGIGRTSVFRAIREGELRARKMGRRTIVTDDDLRAWLASLPVAGKKAA